MNYLILFWFHDSVQCGHNHAELVGCDIIIVYSPWNVYSPWTHVTVQRAFFWPYLGGKATVRHANGGTVNSMLYALLSSYVCRFEVCSDVTSLGDYWSECSNLCCIGGWPPLKFTLPCQFRWPWPIFKVTGVLERKVQVVLSCQNHFLVKFKITHKCFPGLFRECMFRQAPTSHRTIRRPDNHQEVQTEVVWPCLTIICLAKNLLQGTVRVGRRTGRQKRREDIKACAGPEFVNSQRTVENRKRRREPIAVVDGAPTILTVYGKVKWRKSINILRPDITVRFNFIYFLLICNQ